MHITTPPFLTTDLAGVMRGLRVSRGFWGVRRSMSEALMQMVIALLGRVCLRLERLEARFLAGTLRRVAPRVVLPATDVVERVVRKPEGERIWPYRFGWLLPLMGPFRHEGAVRGHQLQAILERPEVVALLIAAPQAARILTPLCRMLSVDAQVLRPGRVVKAKPEKVVVARVRKPRPVVDWGRIPLPRGVLAAARRQGFGKVGFGRFPPKIVD